MDLDQTDLSTLDKLTHVECLLEQRSFHGTFDLQYLKTTDNTMKILYKLTNERIAVLKDDDNNKNSDNDLLLWNGIKHRATGVLTQIRLTTTRGQFSR